MAPVNEEHLTLTEKILRKYKDKEIAFMHISFAIEDQYKLTRNTWVDFDQLSQLSPENFCVVTLSEWMHYESWEGFGAGLYFHLDIIIDQIKTQLLLPQVANILEKAREIDQAQAEQQKAILKKEGILRPTPEAIEQYDLFDTQRQLLTDTLYAFVKANIEKFP